MSPSSGALLLFIVILILGCSSGDEKLDYRLPGALVPRHYDLTLLIDVDPQTKFPYRGRVKIYVKCVEPTEYIVLHARKFTLPSINITALDDNGNPEEDSTIDFTDVTHDEKRHFTIFNLSSSLEENQDYLLEMDFYGNLRKDLDGIYVSSYSDKETKTTKYLVTTQFEAVYARKGFPCFDEPSFKSSFTVTLGHHKDLTAVSNMPLNYTRPIGANEPGFLWEDVKKDFHKERQEFVWSHFKKSVPMSTYLLAFVISEFAFVDSPKGLSNTQFRIWARKDAITQTDYASNVGPKVLTAFEKWFDVKFPLPKQDMVAIPDFAAGAMENWGLITYRETALLYEPTESSFTAKERVASVVAHELAHQWFGNLVTMKWWSDLWLNEGFATYVGSIGVEKVEPTWNHISGSAVEAMRRVLSLDALESSHPVSTEVDDPERITEIFDAISYSKGALLIRMMRMFLGEDVFRQGIKDYLIKHSYNNAEQDDLWQSLTDAARSKGVLVRNVTVKEIMDTWTKQTGFPLLTVTRDYVDQNLIVTQKRYMALNPEMRTSMESWWVPLHVLCEPEVGTDLPPVQWLSNSEGVRNSHQFQHGSSPDQWVLFNSEMLAIYRVNYDARNWALLTAALNNKNYKKVPELSRVQLLADVFELAWAGTLNYTTALELGNYLQHETSYLPLDTGLSALGKIANILLRTPDYGAFQKYIRKLITKAYKSSGGLAAGNIVRPDDLESVKMQNLLSSWACRAKVAGCEASAIQMFESWMRVSNPDQYNPIPVDLRGIVYAVAISRGGVEHWAFLFQRYQNVNVAAAKTSMMEGLTNTHEIWLLQQYLEWSIDDGPEVRLQDAARVISSIASRSVGYYLAKPFIYNRINDIHKAFQGQTQRMGTIVKSLVAQFTTQEELDEFEAWREKNAKLLEGARLAVQQAAERAKVNIAWLKTHRNQVVRLMRELAA